MDDIRERTADIPGIKVEVTAPNAGPPTGKPIQVQLSSDYPDALTRRRRRACRRACQGPGDPRPRQRAADAGHRLATGNRQGRGGEIRDRRRFRSASVVQLVTNGLKITDYRPQTSDKPVDIIVRVPEDRRTLNQIDELRDRRRRRARCRSATSSSACRRSASASSTASTASGSITVTANVAEGVQTAGGTAGDHQPAFRDRFQRAGDLEAQGRGRGARRTPARSWSKPSAPRSS